MDEEPIVRRPEYDTLSASGWKRSVAQLAADVASGAVRPNVAQRLLQQTEQVRRERVAQVIWDMEARLAEHD